MFPTKILLASDGSSHSQLAARVAASIATKTNSELYVAHVGFVPAMYRPEMRGYATHFEALQQETQQVLDEEVRQIEAKGNSVARAHLRMGRSDAEVVELAAELEAGLIVVGSRGRGPIKRAVMGSVSSSVVHHAHCPVLVMRHGSRSEGANYSVDEQIESSSR